MAIDLTPWFNANLATMGTTPASVQTINGHVYAAEFRAPTAADWGRLYDTFFEVYSQSYTRSEFISLLDDRPLINPKTLDYIN